MADFSQHGTIATLHHLGDRSLESLETELSSWSTDRPMSLIIPCLAAEMDGPALRGIVDELASVPYLAEVIIGLDCADHSDFLRAREFFSRLPQHHRIIWGDGPRLGSIEATLGGSVRVRQGPQRLVVPRLLPGIGPRALGCPA